MTRIFIDVVERPPAKGLARATSRAAKGAHQLIGETWQERYLPDHFRRHAAAKYNYQRRRPSTLERKRRQGKPLPLVDSGLAREIALRPRPVKAFPTRAVLRIPGPSYFTMRRRSAARIHLAGEVLRTTAGQERQLQKLGGREFERLLDQEKRAKTTRIR